MRKAAFILPWPYWIFRIFQIFRIFRVFRMSRAFRAAMMLGAMLAFLPCVAQTVLRTEAQATFSSGDNTPLWLNANKYGLSSLETTNGYLRAGIFRSMECDSARKVAFAYGADVAVTTHFTSRFVVQQAYGEMRWLRGLFTIGSKEQSVELRNQQLSSGPQTLGSNARPYPSVRVALPDYWDIPFTKGWVGIKGHIAYGIQTDGRWQRDFTEEQSKFTEHTLVHTKAGYLRIGKPEHAFTAEIGLEMGCQFGGTSHQFDNGVHATLENDASPRGFLHAFIPAGGDSGEGDYKNKEGNHLGSYVLRLNYNHPAWRLSLYGDHFFEDSSQMLFLEYDGYGKGDEWNEWVDNRWFLYDLRDMMLGAEVQLKRQKWVTNIVAEYIYSKHQSGPVYHDRTPSLSDHIGGMDNYYNHYIHTGWQHWGMVNGNPLYRSPLYNGDKTIRTLNNRFKAWHFAIAGHPAEGLSYRLMWTWQQGLGTYDQPSTRPEYSRYYLAEVGYDFPQRSRLAGWSIKAAFGLDHGYWTGNNTGAQFTVARRLHISGR
jgi:hypothetical protein